MTSETHHSSWRESPWFKASTFTAYRQGRFVVAELNGPHWVTSTSSRVGGMRKDIQFLVNHQSCEGAGHAARGSLMMELGMDGYHDNVCEELHLDSSSVSHGS